MLTTVGSKQLAIVMVASLLGCGLALAEEPTPIVITDHIEEPGVVIVTMPEGLARRIRFTDKDELKNSGSRQGGFRIQVFSDNNARTAKSEARTRARNISARFPNYPTYVVYSSPFWRLRVGNFRTQDEANRAARELREAFPAYSKEIRVVRDRISLSGD